MTFLIYFSNYIINTPFKFNFKTICFMKFISIINQIFNQYLNKIIIEYFMKL